MKEETLKKGLELQHKIQAIQKLKQPLVAAIGCNTRINISAREVEKITFRYGDEDRKYRDKDFVFDGCNSSSVAQELKQKIQGIVDKCAVDIVNALQNEEDNFQKQFDALKE